MRLLDIARREPWRRQTRLATLAGRRVERVLGEVRVCMLGSLLLVDSYVTLAQNLQRWHLD